MTSHVTAETFMNTIIEPAIQAVGLWSAAAAQLLLGTALQESGLCHRRQIGGGPALGLWQMEPATHDDCWDNYLKYRSDLAQKVIKVADRTERSEAEWLVAHDPYACVMARIKYLRAPTQLPSFNDIDGQAKYWKSWYNTPQGAGTVDDYLRNWHMTMGN